MNRALFFLLHRSARGRLKRLLRMARQPKYLFGVIMSGVWISLWVLPWLLKGKHQISVLDSLEKLHGAMPAVQLSLGLLLAAFATIWWLLPFGQPSIGLREGELQVLLSSPLPRREIIRYSLLKAQPPILLGCTIMTVFVRAPGWDRALQHFVGVWLFFTIWDLHSKAKRLWLGRSREMASDRAKTRAALLVALLAAGWVAIGLSLLRLDWRGLFAAGDFNGFLTASASWAADFGRSPGGWIVRPFAWLVSPLLLNQSVVGTGARLLSFLPPLAVLAFHEEWVVRSQTRFEEATLEAARRASKAQKGQTRQAKKSKRDRSREPFQLSPTGAPELAIVWKNLMMIRRTSLGKQVWVGFAAAAGIFVLWAAWRAPFWVYAIPLMSGVVLSTLIPMLGAGNLRNDFRADLKLIETLRPWPVPGWRMVAAEVLSPVTIAATQSLLGAGLVLAGHWASLVQNISPLDEIWSAVAGFVHISEFAISPLFVITAFPVSMAMACFSSSLHNVGALAFPGWVPLGTDKKEIAHAMGSNLLLAIIQMLGAALCLIPGFLLVGGVLLVQIPILGIPFSGYELPLLSTLVAIPLLLASAFFVLLGAVLWERLDPSRELLAE